MAATETTPITQSANGSTFKTGHTYDDASRIEHNNGYELLEATSTSQSQDDQERSEDVARDTLPARITNTETFMHLVKSMTGTGMLAMPVSFRNGGLWLSLGFSIVIGVICVHCMHILVRCGDELCQRTGADHLDYASVVEQALEMRGGRMKRCSATGRNIINAFLIIIQIGICCVLTVFVAQNLKQVVDHFCTQSPSGIIYILIVSAALVPFVMLKTLKGIAPISTVANSIMVIGIGIVFYNVFQDLPSVNSRPAVASISTFPLMISQSLYAFEGIAMVLPIYHDMSDRKAFLGRFGILNVGLAIVISLYAVIGFYGYLKYGDDIKGSITLNLSTDSWLNIIARLVFSFCTLFAYLLMFYVPVNIIWPFIQQNLIARGHVVHAVYDYMFRFTLVCIICGLSVLVPHLDLLISLTGAIASSFLALIVPALIEMIVFPPTAYLWTKNIIIILLGLFGFCFGTGYTIHAIVHTYT